MCIAGAATHIRCLADKWSDGSKQLAEVRQQLDGAEQQYKADLDLALANLTTVSLHAAYCHRLRY